MCYWRCVRNLYLKCDHGVTLPDEEIKCDLRCCKFSPVHPPDCKPPKCLSTCWQYSLSNIFLTLISCAQSVPGSEASARQAYGGC